MARITATTNTWLKKSPAQSSALPDSEKRYCKSGEHFDVKHYEPHPGGHWKVLIEGEHWFIFDAAAHGPASHWECSWEEDGADENDHGPTPELINRAVQSQKQRAVGLNLKPTDSFDTLVTPHFTYGEMTLYEEERRFLSAGSIPAMVELLEFLERVRADFNGATVVITSGHRPPAVNRRIGGATYSEHLFRSPGIGGLDFYIKGVDIYQVQDYCDRHWPHSLGYGAKRGFVHLGSGRGRVRWPY